MFSTGIASSQNFSLPGGESLGNNKDLKCHPHQKVFTKSWCVALLGSIQFDGYDFCSPKAPGGKGEV